MLALVCTAAFAVGCVLAGVWLGFRTVTRDAALLARFAVDAREARSTAERIEESVSATLESVERKRASAAAAASRAESKIAAAEAAAAAQQQPHEQLNGEDLSPRERRRAIARRLRAVGGA